MGQSVGVIVGIAAAAFTAYLMFGGGQGLGLPSGRYPVILLIALALGPPLIAGGIAGLAAFGIVYVVLGPVESAARERRANTEARAKEELEALVRRPLAPEAARALVDGELIPVLRQLRVNLEEPSWPYRPSPLHLAAAAGNMALIEAIGERAPKTLTAQDSKTYFSDAAPAGRQAEALAAFVRGLSRAIEKTMSTQDRPLTDDDRALVASHLAQMMAQARETIAVDLDRLKARPVSEARGRGGVVALDEGQYERAIGLLDSAIRLDPAYARAFLLRGRAHAALGHREQAIGDYTEAARLLPTLAEAVMRRGHAREDAGDFDQALVDYQEALRIDPKYAHGYISRGAFSFNRRNQVAAALADFRRALEHDPGNQVATSNIAAVLQTQGADDASLARVSEAILADPQNPDHKVKRGSIHRLRGETERALADLNEALQLSPQHVEALSQRGYILMNSGRHEEALADYRKLERFLPDQAKVWSHKGWLLEQLGRKDEAIASYQAAVKLDPNDPARADLARLGVPVAAGG
jgi:tetratricopeptide (TPR) repeat protein